MPPSDRPRFRTLWVLFYQDASGTPEDDMLERCFCSERAALTWADSHFVVPHWLEQREQKLAADGHVIATMTERHEV
jgi:hypothetical protein